MAGEAALQVEAVQGYFSPSESSLDAVSAEACRRGTFAGRSPDLLILAAPFTLVDPTAVAQHGTPYSYDAHVPLVLFGTAFRAGVYHGQVSPIDLAPTLAAALGITPPALSSGRVLFEALRDEGARR